VGAGRPAAWAAGTATVPRVYDEPFGECEAGPVRRLAIGAEPGVVLEVLDLGATVHRLDVTDRRAHRRNVVVNHPDPQAYLDGNDYRGATIGRVANRIAGGGFEVDGCLVEPLSNEGSTILHGGPDGFDSRIWEVLDHAPDLLRLRLVSPDGDQGFPGEVTSTVTYTTTSASVTVEMESTTTAPTVANLTNHVYWNLDGATTIDDHVLGVEADEYLVADEAGISTGAIVPVDATPYDLRVASRVGDRRIDLCFVRRGPAVLRTDALELALRTDSPGLQVYTGEVLEGGPRSGLAMEPQLFPDAPHHPHFPSVVLRPGETARTSIRWTFG
jgi:galactose mutarotase-like enzyme